MAGTNTNTNTNTNTKKRSRCPNGQRKNPKTGNCEPKKSVKANNNNNKRNNSKKRYKFRRVVKPSAKSKKQKKAMQNELMELSKPYQAHKKEQVVKKALAKKIKANKKIKVNYQKTKGKYHFQRSDKDGEINFSKITSKNAYNFVRAISHPYPGAWSKISINNKNKKIRVFDCEIKKD